MEKLVRLSDRALHLLARSVYALPAGSPHRHGVCLSRDVVYQDSGRRAHLLDVYAPSDAKEAPVILYVHGGGWAIGSKETHRVMALALARAGYVVFLCNYRIGPRHKYPAPLEDAAAALQWVFDNAGEYGGDPWRLGIVGESAGANLALALALCCSLRRPEPFAKRLFDLNLPVRAVAPIYGLLDLNGLDRLHHRKLSWLLRVFLRKAAEAYIGAPLDRTAPASPLASPLLLLEQNSSLGRPLPPVFAAAGTADPLLPDTVRLQHAVIEADGEAECHIYPGEIHAFDIMVWRRAARKKWSALYDFLGRHL